MSKLSTSLAALSFAVCSLTSLGADAQDVKLPPTMTMTAYDTGTVGFNLTVAIGKALKDKYGTDVRVLPAGNDVARIAPLRAGRAIASGMGGGTYFAQEGVFEFATKEWGPQQLQMTLSTVDCAAGDLGVAADIGAKKMSDLKGKRIGFVVGSAALNQFALAMLAFGDLTQKDVKIVEFSSYGAMWKGMINNDVDAAFGNTVTGPAREMEASPRGLIWMPLPHDDDAGWARVWKVAAFLTKFTATCGAGGITKDKPVQMSTYPYPIYTVYANQPEDQVYMLTKAMIATFDSYKDAPGSAGMDAKLQTKNWVIPVHKGAVKALKEVGAWSDDQESFNNNLFKRQAALASAWADYMKSNPPSDEAQFKASWMKARGDALAKAGLPSNSE